MVVELIAGGVVVYSLWSLGWTMAGRLLRRAGKTAAALRVNRLAARLVPPWQHDVRASLLALASVNAFDLGRLDEATALAEEAAALPAKDPAIVIGALTMAAVSVGAQGDATRADALWRRARELA